MKQEKTTRISKHFAKDLDKIRKERLRLKKDKKKMSDRRITQLISKNKYWRNMIIEGTIELEEEEIKELLKDE